MHFIYGRDSTLHTDWYNHHDSYKTASEIIFSIFDVNIVKRNLLIFNPEYCAFEEMKYIENNQDAVTFRQCPL